MQLVLMDSCLLVRLLPQVRPFCPSFFSVGAWSLSVFDMTPESHSSLCHGSVKGGVSFGTNGPLQCSIAPHTKQDDTQVTAFYIASV